MYRYRYALIVLFEWIDICMYVCEYLSLLAFISVFLLPYLCISVCIQYVWDYGFMFERVLCVYVCLHVCFDVLCTWMYIMTRTRSFEVDMICVCLRSRLYEHDDVTHDFVNMLTYLLTYLLTSLLSLSQTDNLPCIHVHTCVMTPVIWSGAILLVAFITTTSYCYDQGGWTAMINAANNGHKDVVEYLVSQGADQDIKSNVSTPLVHLH